MVLTGLPLASAQTAAPPSFGNPLVTIVKLLLSLGLIVALVVLLIRFLARRTQVEQKGSIQVLAARQLAPNKSVQVVDVQGRTLVLGVGEDVTVLADVTGTFTKAEVAAPEGQNTSFGSILAESLQSLRHRHKGLGREEETP